MGLSSDQFISALRATELKSGRWLIRQRTLGQSNTIFVNFVNVPEGVSGADLENNRVMFSIAYFDPDSTEKSSELLRCEMVVSVYRQKYRTRSAKAESILESIQTYCKGIADNNNLPVWKRIRGTP